MTAGGEPVALDLHLVHSLVKHPRRTDWWERGRSAPVRGALTGLEVLDELDDPDARAAARRLFGDRLVVNLAGTASIERVDLLEIAKGTAFGVPRDEKAAKGEQIGLVLVATSSE